LLVVVVVVVCVCVTSVYLRVCVRVCVCVCGISIGAATADLHAVQVHPTGLVEPGDPEAKVKWLAAEALRGAGGIILDNQGRRFCDEVRPACVLACVHAGVVCDCMTLAACGWMRRGR
jgi:hypothetical protein